MRIGFDFDGVLCLTPFGRFAVHPPERADDVPPLADGFERLYEGRGDPNMLRLALEYVRFAWRSAAPGAPEVLRRLAVEHDLYIVTGRSDNGRKLLDRWAERHRVAACFKGIWMAPPGLSSPQHKLAVAGMLGIDIHIDDDPRTAWYLASGGVPRVFLLDHANARGDAAPPPGVTVISTLDAFASALETSV